MFNATPKALGKWYASLNRSLSGGAAARLCGEGDSIQQGAGAVAPFNVNAWLYQLDAMLEAVMGDAGLGIDPLIDVGGNTQDNRYTLAGTRTTDAVAGFVGSAKARSSTTVGSTLTYASPTPGMSDIKVFYRLQSGSGGFTWALDTGATTAVATAGAEGIGPVTIPMTGNYLHSVVLNVTSGPVTILAIEELVNGNGGVKVGKFANTGAAISNFNTAGPTGPLELLNTIGVPDLTIIALETNDYGNLATYTAGIQALITNAKLTGDVLLVAAPTPSQRRGSSGNIDGSTAVPLTTAPTMFDYTQALYTLAETNDCALLDLQALWGRRPGRLLGGPELGRHTARRAREGGQMAPLLSLQTAAGVQLAGVSAGGGVQLGNGTGVGGALWSGSAIAGTAGDLYLRAGQAAEARLYYCTTTGAAGAAVWEAITGV